MNTLEDRLRDAYRSAAQTVRPEGIRNLGDPAVRRPAAIPAKTDRRAPMIVALAAAAAVAAVAVLSAVVVPQALRGDKQDTHAAARAYAGGRVPSGPVPRYFVAVVWDVTASNPNGTELEVFSSATGRVVGRIAAPGPGRDFQAVTPLGNDRTFLAEAQLGSARDCGTWLYQFRLTARGRPTALAPFVVPSLAGRPVPDSLAASADGKVIAYDTASCVQTSASIVKDYGQVGVIHLPSGKVTSWPYKFPAVPYSLSLSADGTVLGMVSNPSNGTRVASSEFNSAWVLRTGSAPGQLAQRYRKVAGPPAPPTAAVLSPTGAITYTATPGYLGSGPGPWRWRLTIDAYQTATGRRTRVLHVFPRLNALNDSLGVSQDISGRYLLMYLWTDRPQLVDLATWQARALPADLANAVSIAW